MRITAGQELRSIKFNVINIIMNEDEARELLSELEALNSFIARLRTALKEHE